MRKTIFTLSIILATCVGVTHAQAIFRKYGFNKKPLTLSKGKYNEFFTNDEVVQIGTVRFNTRTNKVIQLLEEDTTKNNYLSDRSSMWYSVDPLAEKYPNYSPYVYCMNNPIKYIDPDGKEVYMVFYTAGNKRGDEMFHAAALTRQRDIQNNGSFNPAKDIVVLTPVRNIATIKEQVNLIQKEYGSKYGKTAEFSLWSHAGTDGPTGTAPTTSNALDKNQMTIEGWSQIGFDWSQDAKANFLGCKTGVASDNKASFVTSLSAQTNFKDVQVSGQTSSAYPSKYTNARENSDLGNGNFIYTQDADTYFSPTYMVGGFGRSQDWNMNQQNVALPLRTSQNGKGNVGNYQAGTTK